MKELMYDFGAGLIAAVLLAVVLAAIEIGFRFGRRNRGPDVDDDSKAHINATQASTLGILALLLAFTFSLSLQRFDTRSDAVVDEANAIGTAYLRLDLLPAAAQPALREKFRAYTDARIAVYRSLPDMQASDAQFARAAALQAEIWNDSLEALRTAPPEAKLLLIPALNDMIDITTTRAVALQTHTPPIILAALVVLTMICSLLVGYGLAGGKPFATNLHMLGFALMMTVTIYVILDLDHPRVGLIRLDYVDQAFKDLRAGME